MITIGQLAAYAGVTVKAVRHYHRLGLLAEPPRDASGYRRYTADHAVRLVKIRTLADAGVPLARVEHLLDAAPEELAAALDAIDRALQERAEAIRHSRERIARLRQGEELFVSPEVAEFLDRLRAVGTSPRQLRLERDLWILLQAVSPERAAASVADKRAAIEDPEFRGIYLAMDAAFDWPADDPRLDDLAERTRRWFSRHPGGDGDDAPESRDASVARLIMTADGVSSPAWDRLGAATS